MTRKTTIQIEAEPGFQTGWTARITYARPHAQGRKDFDRLREEMRADYGHWPYFDDSTYGAKATRWLGEKAFILFSVDPAYLTDNDRTAFEADKARQIAERGYA